MTEENNFDEDEITRPDLPSSIIPKEGCKDTGLEPCIPRLREPTLIGDIIIEHFREYLEEPLG